MTTSLPATARPASSSVDAAASGHRAVPLPRWSFIDVLRGFALTGILFVNTLDITALGLGRLLAGGEPVDDPLRNLLYLTVQTRFVPIFAWLFGMSLWFVLIGARGRARRPWLVLVRRLVALGAIGALLELVYLGNILPDYALSGMVVLAAVLFVPPRILLIGGGGLTLVITVFAGSNSFTDPALMLFGAGAAGCGVPALLQRGGRLVVTAFAVAVAASVPLLIWQTTQPGDPRFTQAGSIAGLAMAIAYTTGLSLLWRTPVRQLLAAVFEPLGRMALTNYITAAVVVFLAAQSIDFGHMTSVLPAVLLSLGIIAVQSVTSRLWLHAFRYGPFEWLWRMATWLKPVRMRRTRPVNGVAASSEPAVRLSHDLDGAS